MDYLSVTTAEGDRYYLRMVEKKDDDDEEGESFKAWTPQTSVGGRGDQASNVRGSGLCGRSYGAIYNEALVEQSKVRREADGSDELTEEGLVTFRFRLIFSILDGKMAFTIQSNSIIVEKWSTQTFQQYWIYYNLHYSGFSRFSRKLTM